MIWERKIIPLLPGENVLGRDEEATVRIDSPGVSRRHARIVVEKGRARLEDLGSKNGTYLKEERLPGPGALEDGDTFRLGRLLLVYRSSALRGLRRRRRWEAASDGRARPSSGARGGAPAG